MDHFRQVSISSQTARKGFFLLYLPVLIPSAPNVSTTSETRRVSALLRPAKIEAMAFVTLESLGNAG
jgi:hypothetical protein